MPVFLALPVCLAFVALAAWHFWMASRPSAARTHAVPSVAGKPLFTPSVGATVAVGVGLLFCAALVAATGRVIDVAFPSRWLAGLSILLSLGLLARAIGDFRYLGFFKRVRDSRFARLDTRVYSPACLVLAAGVAYTAIGSGF